MNWRRLIIRHLISAKGQKGAANKFLATITNDLADLNFLLRSHEEVGSSIALAM